MLNLPKAVVDYLTERRDFRFSVQQIAELIFATFPDERHAKKANTHARETNADLLQQLVAKIGSQRPRMHKKNPLLKLPKWHAPANITTPRSQVALANI